MLVIGNGRLVTRDPEQPFFENGAVAMDGTAVKKVGTLEEIKKEFPDAEYVDAKGGVIMPAFIISTVPWQEVFPLKDMTPRVFWIFWTACGGPLTAT